MIDKQYHAFAVDYPCLAGQIITPVVLIPHFPFERHIADQMTNNPQVLTFNALWDTGASHSVITPEVVVRLNISKQIIGFTKVCGVNSESVKPIYKVGGIILPNKVLLPNWQFLESEISGGVNLLIGMDIISRGDLAISNFGGRTKFSFSLPPHEQVLDLVERAARSRNTTKISTPVI